jgi:hypothetical protein
MPAFCAENIWTCGFDAGAVAVFKDLSMLRDGEPARRAARECSDGSTSLEIKQNCLVTKWYLFSSILQSWPC